MAKKKNSAGKPLVSMSREEREEAWDDLYLKDEGIIVEFDPETSTGKIKSIADDQVYQIDSRELIRTRIELRSGDKVLFAPIEDASGEDFARIIRSIDLTTASD